jgi:hypothetical protein
MRPCAQAALALVLVLPFAAASAQTKITRVLEGSLILLPSPGANASRTTAPAAMANASRRPRPSHAIHIAFAPDQPAGSVSAPIKAVVTPNRDSLIVWAADAERIELRLEDDTEHSRIIECRRATDVAGEPARCSAPEGEPPPAISHATLTVYYGLDGSR